MYACLQYSFRIYGGRQPLWKFGIFGYGSHRLFIINRIYILGWSEHFLFFFLFSLRVKYVDFKKTKIFEKKIFFLTSRTTHSLLK